MNPTSATCSGNALASSNYKPRRSLSVIEADNGFIVNDHTIGQGVQVVAKTLEEVNDFLQSFFAPPKTV